MALREPVDQLNLPPLWSVTHQALSDYTQGRRFNLTECTSWARNRLHEQGFKVSGSDVAFVVSGAAYCGMHLHGQPAPRADEIRGAYVANVLTQPPSLPRAIDFPDLSSRALKRSSDLGP